MKSFNVLKKRERDFYFGFLRDLLIIITLYWELRGNKL